MGGCLRTFSGSAVALVCLCVGGCPFECVCASVAESACLCGKGQCLRDVTLTNSRSGTLRERDAPFCLSSPLPPLPLLSSPPLCSIFARDLLEEVFSSCSNS